MVKNGVNVIVANTKCDTMKKNINLSGIQKAIHEYESDIDPYTFIAQLSERFIKEHDPMWGKEREDDPYTDLLFNLMEINGIEFY